VRAADPGYAGPRPRVQIWHGANDSIVSNLNQTELIEQWTDVAGTDATADTTETSGDLTRTQYRAGATVVVESYRVAAMSHAVCIGAADAEHPCGAGHGSYYEDHGTCSTWRAAQFFGLVGGGTPGDDTTPPMVDVLSPGNGAEVSGAVTVVVAASDDVGVDRVELAVDGVAVATDDTAPYQLQWDATAGDHALRATAWDAAGNEAIDDDTMVTMAGGGGPGDDDDDDGGGDGPGGSNELPGCGGLDAGGGASGAAMALLVAAALIRSGRRSRRRARR
jgi:hypothetical protein